MSEFEANFNVDEEAMDEPLVPDGTYNGSITNVKFYPEGQNLKFYITLSDNGGTCTDGETPVDGATIPLTVWFPRAGDKDEQTKSGRQSKHQWKVNNIKKVASKLGITMNTPDQIMDAIANSEWVGIEVSCKISVNEYEGNINNQVDSAEAI
jgi:hypothetical protein